MHELAVTESILGISLRHAEKAGAIRITDIHLVIGDLSSIVDDSVQFYWEMVSGDTIARNAQLHFRRIPARLRCRECGCEYEPGDGLLACPGCEGSQIEVTAGEEFFVESIDVETRQDGAGR
jgi:hydrogenase nickel incorporation protein HypA/HybF